MNAPDEFSNAWYRQQFRGINHLLNRCAEEYTRADEQIQTLQGRVLELEQAMERAKAEIGKLLDSMEKCREAYHELRNGRQGNHQEPTDSAVRR